MKMKENEIQSALMKQMKAGEALNFCFFWDICNKQATEKFTFNLYENISWTKCRLHTKLLPNFQFPALLTKKGWCLQSAHIKIYAAERLQAFAR